ncbi:hypothetical protein O181_132499 [Austropuccinia psidii MF-1]|uniref:Uncharacterized protein n=1 Tax=Austropuccinia psidii MF-1 TaxID=1389203 RepID=A0A9Q3L4Z3_9BASI|nr:hypothetical protein [Austropuccinia psidii MF-1]
MEYTIIQTSNQKDEGLAQQKEGENQGRIPSSFYQQASPRREEEQEKEYGGNHIPEFTRCHGNFIQNGQNLDLIQGQRGTKNETTPFPKKLNLSPDFVNTLTEIKNIILCLKRH